jgi:putative two-component system response regulator
MHTRDFFEAKILIVDDETQKVRLVTELLALGGFRTIQSQTDSARATATFESFKPDLVILDLHMAPLDGIEILTQLNPRIAKGEYLPILMLTGDISREAKERALNAGAMDFLAKPFNATEILLRVRNLLETRRLYLELRDEKSMLEERVRERTAQLEEARNEVIERLAIVAEFRDDTTGQHTQRVSSLVREVALEMGLPNAEAELIGRASLLHDIGKIGISDALLLKPGRYTDAERDEMKKHANIGGDILRGSKSDVLQKAEQIARYHHERWNGTGHHGLTAEAIPIEARITAVADVYDALTSARPYKEAWKEELACAEIERLSGNHFDPDVVEAFLRVVRAPVALRAS